MNSNGESRRAGPGAYVFQGITSIRFIKLQHNTSGEIKRDIRAPLCNCGQEARAKIPNILTLPTRSQTKTFPYRQEMLQVKCVFTQWVSSMTTLEINKWVDAPK